MERPLYRQIVAQRFAAARVVYALSGLAAGACKCRVAFDRSGDFGRRGPLARDAHATLGATRVALFVQRMDSADGVGNVVYPRDGQKPRKAVR
jgi:hypothetical protein